MKREELEQLTIKQLKAECKELGIKGYGRKSEDELIDLILSNTTEVEKVVEIAEPQKDAENKQNDMTEQLGAETDKETDKETLDNTKEVESSTVTFKKLIKGAFGFNGNTFKGSTFELSEEEANHPKIKNAIKGGLIEIK